MGGGEEGRAGYRDQLLTRASEGTAPRLSLGESLAVQLLVSPLALIGSWSRSEGDSLSPRTLKCASAVPMGWDEPFPLVFPFISSLPPSLPSLIVSIVMLSTCICSSIRSPYHLSTQMPFRPFMLLPTQSPAYSFTLTSVFTSLSSTFPHLQSSTGHVSTRNPSTCPC